MAVLKKQPRDRHPHLAEAEEGKILLTGHTNS
jgi:hypothetical protein